MMKSQKATLTVHSEKASISKTLNTLIHKSFLKAAARGQGTFYIALSGGSLPSFLETLPQSFVDANLDPQWDKWHVLLADERLVPSTHDDSNLKAVKSNFLDAVPMIPEEQIYGIDEELLGDGVDQSTIPDTKAIAQDYQARVFSERFDNKDGIISTSSSVLIDCALLGFGPDGHTCSLFPNHELLNENELLVASIEDSPKPPPKRITLTMKTLNQFTEDVIFVGAGESKGDILKDIIQNASLDERRINNDDDDKDTFETLKIMMNNNTIYPCGMIRLVSDSLHYITDESAIQTLRANGESLDCSCLRSSM